MKLYEEKYEQWLQDPATDEESKKDLRAIKDNEAEK